MLPARLGGSLDNNCYSGASRMSPAASHSSFRREELGGNRVRFTVTSTSRSGTAGGGTPSLVPPIICGIVVFVITASFNSILAVIFGIGAGVALHRMRQRRCSSGGPATHEFSATPDAITAQGRTVAVADVQEFLWRDWSMGSKPGNCSLFIETRQGESVILATNMDEATVSGLAADVARPQIHRDLIDAHADLAEGVTADLEPRQFGCDTDHTSHGSACAFPPPAPAAGVHWPVSAVHQCSHVRTGGSHAPSGRSGSSSSCS